MKMPRWRPQDWVSLVPNGLGHVKPNHYGEMLRVAWENRDQLPFAWRILTRGVCDGCALGTTGMRDFTLDGVHLCTVRLNLLRLNTAGPLDVAALADVAPLEGKSAAELRALGRLPYPLVRYAGEPGFRRVSWDAALDLIGGRIRRTAPDRLAFYLTSRGVTNETYYVGQKVARFLGTNNVDNSSRICHAPSTTALKKTLGVAASTCSYRDWYGTDLLVFVGSDVPNNQPVTTKYIYEARQRGTKVLVINPYREPGLERYWVPSALESAVFGTKLTDRFFQIATGGDIGFLNGVLKHLIEHGWVDEAFVRAHTTGWDALRAELAGQSWEQLERASGTTRAEMLDFARLYGQARTAVFVWSMGITQHRFGVDNVTALVNLALARGMVGREGCGLMPIRGHSGVQGSAEVGAIPNALPGGAPLEAQQLERFERLWGFAPPPEKGLMAVEMIDAAERGAIDVLYSLGGNFLETLPEPRFVRRALERVPLRVHQDIVLTPQMLLAPPAGAGGDGTAGAADASGAVVVLPARTRYEQRGGGTETSTERRIYFSPEIPGRRVGESRAEWEILMQVAEHAYPERRHLIHFADVRQILDEIARAIPSYDGIQHLRKAGDAIQWGGPRLCEGPDGQRFPTPDGKAAFVPVQPPETALPDGAFLMSTRRGKQFNSMVQAKRDPLNGALREDVLMNEADVRALGLQDGAAIVLRSEAGEYRGRAKVAPIKERNVQVHWPEGNRLLKHGQTDPVCGIPDYNAVVRIEPVLDRVDSVDGAGEPVAAPAGARA
jgi:molybdopterin-dependent oxidoreductase alpha subunit